jgi:hypothetical protein
MARPMLDLIPFPAPTNRYLMTPGQHLRRAAEIRAKNPQSEAASFHELAGRAMLAKLVHNWLEALKNEHREFAHASQ